MTPKVSVIIPCYNQERYLAECLDSVLAQTFDDWECIIINDGSDDGSEAIAKTYTELDCRFKYIYQPNQGVVAARNNAIRQSCGKYILPLDGDDKVAPQYLELAVKAMDQDDDVSLVHCDVEYFGAITGKMNLPELTPRNILAFGCCVNATLFRRRDFDLVGGFKSNMKKGWEDWDFFISIVSLGNKTYRIPQVLFYYRTLPDSRNHSIDESVKQGLRRNMVSNNPSIYAEEYRKLYEDWKRYDDNIIVKDTFHLIYERPLYCKIIHLNIIIVKTIQRVLHLLQL